MGRCGRHPRGAPPDAADEDLLGISHGQPDPPSHDLGYGHPALHRHERRHNAGWSERRRWRAARLVDAELLAASEQFRQPVIIRQPDTDQHPIIHVGQPDTDQLPHEHGDFDGVGVSIGIEYTDGRWRLGIRLGVRADAAEQSRAGGEP